MKMVKSLLLGSAAGLVAVAGAQAADLPVKAKPVQYVKVCSLYGAGFYYVPGTDMCLKVGGWVRGYYGFNANGSTTNGNLVNNFNNRTTSDNPWRVRGYITADARSQTAYGTVRGYIAVGYSGEAVQGGAAPSFSANRGFIQWAGFTFGLAQSFYDFYSAPAVSYFGGYIQPSEDTGDAGQYVAAYTAQFGGGLSATVAAENPVFNRRSGIFNAGSAGTPNNFAGNSAGTTAATVGTLVANAGGGQTGTPTDATGGNTAPDVVANLRVDQAWGSAQVMGGLHDLHPLYYTSSDASGGPSDRWGWAIGGGLKLNVPFLGQGDYVQAEVNYTQGAVGYVIAGNQRYAKYNSDTNYGTAFILDAVYGSGTDLQLTTAWGLNASYEHHWNPAWKTSLYGGYLHFAYNDSASALLGRGATASWGAATSGPCVAGAFGGCFDSSYFDIGTRTQWNVTKDFYLGLDVAYTHLNTALKGTSFAMPANGSRPAATRLLDDQDAIVAQFRVHRDFYP